MFNYFHVVIFIASTISGLVNLVKANSLVDPKNSKKYSLEKILGFAATSLFWMFYGIYKKIDDDLLMFEAFTFCCFLAAFISKLNFSNQNTLFGKLIPGHGTEENSLMKKIKYTLLYAISIALLIFTIAILLLI